MCVLHSLSTTVEGYRLTNSGYDFLALRVLCGRDTITSFGRQIGVGKESGMFVRPYNDTCLTISEQPSGGVWAVFVSIFVNHCIAHFVIL